MGELEVSVAAMDRVSIEALEQCGEIEVSVSRSEGLARVTGELRNLALVAAAIWMAGAYEESPG